MHFDLNNPVSLTSFAASAFDIKAKAAFLITAYFRFVRYREYIANVIEYSGISSWVGARRPTNWRLIDVDYFLQMLDSRNFFMDTGTSLRFVQITRQRLIQYFIDQRRLA